MPVLQPRDGSIREVVAHYGDRIRYVTRHLPLTRVHPHAVQAARASEAAAMQGAFFPYSTLLYERQSHLEDEDLIAYAGELGLDVDRFVEDFRGVKAAMRVDDDRLDAELMDLPGTPSFFIGLDRYEGPYDSASLIRALDAYARNGGASADGARG